jgi:hypothetical protein
MTLHFPKSNLPKGIANRTMFRQIPPRERNSSIKGMANPSQNKSLFLYLMPWFSTIRCFLYLGIFWISSTPLHLTSFILYTVACFLGEIQIPPPFVVLECPKPQWSPFQECIHLFTYLPMSYTTFLVISIAGNYHSWRWMIMYDCEGEARGLVETPSEG